MAQIHEYTAETQVSGPMTTRQARTADTGDIGNAVSQLGNSIEQAGKAIDQRNAEAEVSDLTAQMAQRQADMAKSLDDAMNAPGAASDKNLASKFMDQYDQQMSDLVDNTKSPQAAQYVQRANATMRGQFQIQAIHRQTALAGEQAVGNFQQSSSTLSANLINDPSSADSARKLNDLAIDNLPIPDSKKDELRAESETQLSIAEIQGWTKLDPQGTAKRLAAGEWDEDLNGAQKNELEYKTDIAIKAKQIQADADRNRRDDVASRQQETEKSRLLSKLYSPDGLDTKEVIGNPKLDEATQEHFIGIIEKDSTKKAQTDDNVYKHVLMNLDAPEGDPHKITNTNQIYGFIGNGLSGHDAETLANKFQSRRNPDNAVELSVKSSFEGAAKLALKADNPLIASPEAMTAYAQFSREFEPAYQEQRQKGVPWQQLLDRDNPDSLFSKTLRRYESQSLSNNLSSIHMGPQTPPAATSTQVQVGGKRYNVKSGAKPNFKGQYRFGDLEETK